MSQLFDTLVHTVLPMTLGGLILWVFYLMFRFPEKSMDLIRYALDVLTGQAEMPRKNAILMLLAGGVVAGVNLLAYLKSQGVI